MSDTHTAEGVSAYRGHRMIQPSGRSEIASSEDQLDSFSVTSGGSLIYPGLSESASMSTVGAGGGNSGLYLTPAQMALQQQLKSKHAELSRRIAMQQAELLRLGEQLALTYRDPSNFYETQQSDPQQQQPVHNNHQLNVTIAQPQQQQFMAMEASSPHLISPNLAAMRPPQHHQQMNNAVIQPQLNNGMDIVYDEMLEHQYLSNST